MNPTLSAPEPAANRHERARPPVRGTSRFSSDFLLFVSILGDALVIASGLCLGFWFRFKSGLPFRVEAGNVQFHHYRGLILIGTLFLLFTFAYLQLYHVRMLAQYRQTANIILKGTVFWLFAYLGLSLTLITDPPISRMFALTSFAASLASLLVWRWLFQTVLARDAIAECLRKRTLFVGWNEEAARLASHMISDPASPYEIVGCLAFENEPVVGTLPAYVPTIPHGASTVDVLKEHHIETVIFTDIDKELKDIVRLANFCQENFIQFMVIPSYFQILVSGLHLETIAEVPVLGISGLPLDRFMNRFLKRTIDIVGAIVGLIVFAPAMAVCAVLVYLESPGGVLFTQERLGRQGQPFRMHKLRSMKLGADQTDHINQSTQREDSRLLRVGKFMRRWNLDESPQFWNVLRGEMSLVGPRPERVFHTERLSREIPHYNARHTAKPGMTGWAQVNGLRGDTSLTERVRYDLYYLENWSLWLDLQILVLTFLRRDNAY